MPANRFVSSAAASEACHRIQAASAVYVTAHIVPDGDTIGSALGLYWGLTQLGKQVRLACADPVPDNLHFLSGWELIKAQKPEANELLLITDTSDLQRLGSLYVETLYRNRPLINIDHHVTNVQFGTVNWIEPRAASTAEILVELLQALNVCFEPRIATCLLTAIATDTLGFRIASTSPELMEVAAQLMRAGASLADIIERAFNTRELYELQLQGKIVASMRVDDGLVWSDNTIQMRREAGANESSGSGTGTLLLSAKSAKVSIIFIEKEKGKTEISLRSRPGYNISQIAFALGGGGHPQAAGCTLSMSLPEAHEQVLPAVRALLQKSVASNQ